MFKRALILFCFIFLDTVVLAQSTHRYKDRVFADVLIDKDLSYTGNKAGNEKNVLFDLFQPKAVDTLPRPLLIWMHGGGFKFGSKNAAEVQLWCKTFAQRGYVCAAVNYTLSKKNPLFNADQLKISCYDAVGDVRKMLTYFKQNASRYNIDTNKIILAGNSAGGITALQAAYGTPAQFAGLAGIKGDTAKPGNSSPGLKVAAVISFWGAMFNVDWLQNAGVPIVLVHGQKDRVVHIDHQNSLMYGSLPIHLKADSLKIPNALKVYNGYAHQLQKHFNPLFASKATKKRWLEAGQFAADFLYATLFTAK